MQDNLHRTVLLCFSFLFIFSNVKTEAASSEDCAIQPHLTFEISIDKTLAENSPSGRMLVLMSTQTARSGELIPFFGSQSRSVWIAAKEVKNFSSRQVITIDPLDLVYPNAFCNAPADKYYIKAILDIDHNFAYSPLASDGDLYSDTKHLEINPSSSNIIPLKLDKRLQPTPLEIPPQVEELDFISPSLTKFWGRTIRVKALVLLPPNYADESKNYPTVFSIHGFGVSQLDIMKYQVKAVKSAMENENYPQMIWVFPIIQTAMGSHVFANSVNNGKWGDTMKKELIPALEKKYRMKSSANNRLLTGHSSGAWAALWLQVNYPDDFGGAWAIAPDPVDFRNFVGIDLTKIPTENFYYEDDGSERIGMRAEENQGQSMKDLAQQEFVFGDYGGQVSTFEAVFSPRANDGKPVSLFDRNTGVIDTQVANYWIKNYDISHFLKTNWKMSGEKIARKLHIIVGTKDNMRLNESAKLLQQTIQSLGGKKEFKFVKGKDHWSVVDQQQLNIIAHQMYSQSIK
ncbi:MAG: hypothetical protein KUG78_13085 [Kangiellaceae bacterium]|nr:hypothetical protein [Kangiellaceae bacterium]